MENDHVNEDVELEVPITNINPTPRIVGLVDDHFGVNLRILDHHSNGVTSYEIR